MSLFHALRARLGLLSRRSAESRIDTEIAFHIEMETARLMREQKLDHDEARRRALATFGGVQQHRETLREGRGTAWMGGMSLDLKLGGRMLVKYPGLTIVGGLAMAFGIWFGAVTFEMLSILQNPDLPLPDGPRIVQIQNWDTKANSKEGRALRDFQLWRSSVRSVTDLGAYRDLSANVVGADGSAKPAIAAEISASAFRVAPQRPLHGRVLDPSDERVGAPPVVVLGFPVWRDRFNSDPNVVGRTVQIGSTYATVVGVMPEGYAFPMFHELWLPFQSASAETAPRTGPLVTVFGKLAPNATLETAQAELTSVGRRAAAESPTTHAQLQPRVKLYADSGPSGPEMLMMKALIYFMCVVLVVVVCSNVSLLLFARAASRETEILVRSALGASRRRIVTQLFAEALVLGAVSVVVALAAAQLALTNWGRPYLEVNSPNGLLPFWYEFNLSPTTVLVACGLAVLGAAVAGILPARKITKGLGTQLRAGTSGGGGVKFSGVWTAVIVVQVALTVLLPTVVKVERNELERVEAYTGGFASEQYLAANLGIDLPPPETSDRATIDAALSRFTGLLETLRRRVEAEPGVTGVTFVDVVPRDYHASRRVELTSLGEKTNQPVRIARIDPNYFDVLGQPPIAGRAFTPADLDTNSRVVIVDQVFVDLVLKGRNPIGQRMRIGTWTQFESDTAQIPLYEIVGLVKELGMTPLAQGHKDAGMYFPAVPGRLGALSMIVHTRGDPLAIAPRVREIATALDPTLHIDSLDRMDKFGDPFAWFIRLWMKLTMGLTGIALLLSLAGIYSVLAYTVAKRTREIGVRVALGASSRRIITSIFRRPLIQVGSGVFTGILLVGVAMVLLQRTEQFGGIKKGITGADVAMLAAYAVVMLAVCMLACIVPTRRALKVQPTEALRAE